MDNMQENETVETSDVDYTITNYCKDFNILIKNPNLTNYYYFSKRFSDDLIAKVEKLAEKYQLIEGNVSGTIVKDYRDSKISWIPKTKDSIEIYKFIVDLGMIANREMWNFDLTSLNEDLQYTVYEGTSNGHYDWHMDFGGHTTSTRKLSITIQLSSPEEYEGGELQLMVHRNVSTMPKDKGTVVVFPSYLTHRVKPVTKGVRKSLVIWIHGPCFK